MNWGRAKTILIVLFLIVDLFLFVVLMRTKASVSHIAKETVEQTVAFALENGIQISAEQIPQKRINNQSILLHNFFAQPEKGAKKMLGEDARVTETDPANYHFVYESPKGTVSVSSLGFYYTKTQEASSEGNEKADQREIIRQVYHALYRMGIPAESVELISPGEENGLYTFEAIPRYEGEKIFGVSMHIVTDGKDIIRMSGNWFSGVEEEPQEGTLLDITAVVAGLSFQEGKKPMTVQSVGSAYYVADEYVNSREISAVPVYTIQDDKDNIHIFDARDGSVIA